MKQNPLATEADRRFPAPPLRRLTRWAVPRWGWLTFAGLLLVVGVWTAAWELGLKLGPRWDGGASTGLVTFPLHGAIGRVCVIGAVVWLLLVGAVWPQCQPFFAGTGSWHLGVRYRQQIREGRPVEAGLLRAYGAFALAGFALGLVLALRLAVDLGWRNPVIKQFWQVVNQGFLPLAVLYLAGRLVRAVWFLRDFDYFVGGQARECADAMIEEEAEETEADQEYELKTIRGWAFVVLVGGFLGGMLLLERLIPEPDGTAAFQGSVSGLILSAGGLYSVKTRPRRWRLWLALVILGAIGFMVFTQISWASPLRYQMLGVLWGAAVGTTSTLLYLRQLNTK